MKKEVVEVCPHCDSEVVMMWDIESDGYMAFCPYCGKRLMLCDECLHADDNEYQVCKFPCLRRKENENESPDQTAVV